MEATEEELMYSQAVKRQLLHLFQQMINKITPEVFNEIFQQFQESDAVVTNIDEIVQTFKDDLYMKICENFKDMWHIQEIDYGLNVLHFCKKKCQNDAIAWRPTGKTPEEQTKFLRVHYLQKKIAFVTNVVDALKEACNNIFDELKNVRKVLEEHTERRQAISEKMDIRMAQLSNLDNGNGQIF